MCKLNKKKKKMSQCEDSRYIPEKRIDAIPSSKNPTRIRDLILSHRISIGFMELRRVQSPRVSSLHISPATMTTKKTKQKTKNKKQKTKNKKQNKILKCRECSLVRMGSVNV